MYILFVIFYLLIYFLYLFIYHYCYYYLDSLFHILYPKSRVFFLLFFSFCSLTMITFFYDVSVIPSPSEAPSL